MSKFSDILFRFASPVLNTIIGTEKSVERKCNEQNLKVNEGSAPWPSGYGNDTNTFLRTPQRRLRTTDLAELENFS